MFCFEKRSHYIVQVGTEFTAILPQVLGFQACTIIPSLFKRFLSAVGWFFSEEEGYRGQL